MYFNIACYSELINISIPYFHLPHPPSSSFPPLQPDEGYRTAICDDISSHFRPFNNGPPSIDGYNVTCNATITSGCEVGDLTGKFGLVTVSGTV